MSHPRFLLNAIAELPLSGPVRIMNLCSDQERAISLSGLREALRDRVDLVAGPGCVASVCPQADVFQAIQLAMRHPVTLLAADSMLHLPIDHRLGGPTTLAAARRRGADVCAVSAPIEALVRAREEPAREMVLFVAGFETLLAPLAGMIAEGLPDNLSVMVCGRRVEPLLEQWLRRGSAPRLDALLLPGNRCAITGTRAWERLSSEHKLPAAVAGYTAWEILGAIHALLQQHCGGEARLDNRYRVWVRPGGNVMACDQLDRVFEVAEGQWRGLGSIRSSAFRLRQRYRAFGADQRFPDYRGQGAVLAADLPAGCECAAVVGGHKSPVDCRCFEHDCRPAAPRGPCMASQDGACHLRCGLRQAA